jgi:hypothetical protein
MLEKSPYVSAAFRRFQQVRQPVATRESSSQRWSTFSEPTWDFAYPPRFDWPLLPVTSVGSASGMDFPR